MIDLHTARSIAERARLSEDISSQRLDSNALEGRDQFKDSMLRHGILISESMTPILEKGISDVCDRLSIPRTSVAAFVYNRADVQADCVIDTPNTCVLRFTSGLVNLMGEKEFQFVAAHELGHFLLGHGACSQYSIDGSAEQLLTQRARELSADRIGFLGIDNIDESIQAIIKTASGLGDNFLRFDVSSFMSQTKMLSNPSRGESQNSTHPSMIIRCKALLWFSMSITCLNDLHETSSSIIQKIDDRVIRDLEAFVDGQVRSRKLELKNDITLWKSCLLIINEGVFQKNIQDRLSKKLGETSLNGLKSFFDSHSKEEIEKVASKRLEACIQSLYKEFRNSADEIETSAIKLAYKIIDSQILP